MFKMKPKKILWDKISADMLFFLWTILLCEITLISCLATEESSVGIHSSNWTSSFFTNISSVTSHLRELPKVGKVDHDKNVKDAEKIIPNYVLLNKTTPDKDSTGVNYNSESSSYIQPKNIEVINPDVISQQLITDILIRTSKRLVDVSKELRKNFSVLNEDNTKTLNNTSKESKLKSGYSSSSASLAQAILDVVHHNVVKAELKEKNCDNSSCILEENLNSSSLQPIIKSSNSEFDTKEYLNHESSDGDDFSDGIKTEENKRIEATSRQFVFHPYFPHEKDIPPDEKISFQDVLPVKMVKFVKQMVEEAPWEQMFMKMVRMIVDQFVDKIIEKMFAQKGDDDKWRSMDVVLTPTWILPTYSTPISRLRRSVAEDSKEDQQEEVPSYLPRRKIINEIIKKKKSLEERSWLDQFLDYVFPDVKYFHTDEKSKDRIEKRETAIASRNELLRKIIIFFVETYEKFSEFPFNNNPDDKHQDSLRYRVLKEVLPALFETKKLFGNGNSDMHNSILPSLDDGKLATNLERRDLREGFLKIASENSHRRKRSLGNRSNRMEDEKRLWQASRRSKPPSHHRRDECSLRQACNAGRLLSRLPSIHEITLQLRSYHNEPHWDAFIWGIKKKKCSKIYCKRHRSPKGSKYSPWNSSEETVSRRHENSKISSHSEESAETAST